VARIGEKKNVTQKEMGRKRQCTSFHITKKKKGGMKPAAHEGRARRKGHDRKKMTGTRRQTGGGKEKTQTKALTQFQARYAEKGLKLKIGERKGGSKRNRKHLVKKRKP